ncbi:MAG: DUF2726 domain-containing protein [Lachnospira eligens]
MNTYTWIILIIILIVVNSLLNNKTTAKKINKIKKESEDINTNINNFPYKAKLLLTKSEYTFFKTLQKILDNDKYIICPKVRLEDFIDVTDKQEIFKYRGYIKSRHVDFLICDNNLHILFAIELDDKTHNSEKAKNTDEFKNKLFEKIGIKLYRIKTEDNYEISINNIINS